MYDRACVDKIRATEIALGIEYTHSGQPYPRRRRRFCTRSLDNSVLEEEPLFEVKIDLEKNEMKYIFPKRRAELELL